MHVSDSGWIYFTDALAGAAGSGEWKHIAADYRSSHGVFINGRQIATDMVLHNGDKIKIGNSTLMYLADDHADPPTAFAAAKKMGEWKRSTLMHKP